MTTINPRVRVYQNSLGTPDPAVGFPVEITDESDRVLIGPLDLEEAKQLQDDIGRVISEIEDRGFVQVVFMGYDSSDYRYTYRDTSGTLSVGDVVEVPTTTQRFPRLAKVVALGRGSWDGAVLNVTAKLTREEIAA